MHSSLLFHSSYLSNLVSSFKISLSCTCQPTVSLNKTFPETAPHDFGYILLGRTEPVADPNYGVWTGILGLQHLWLRKQEKRELAMAESVFATDPRLLANL